MFCVGEGDNAVRNFQNERAPVEIGNAKCHSWETTKAFVVILIFQTEWVKFQQKTQARTGVKEWLLP